MDSVTGVVTRVVYAREDTGYAVLQIRSDDEDAALINVIGPLAGLQNEDLLEFEGEWTLHPKFGRQFRATRYTLSTLQSEAGLRRYLASGVLPGVGEAMANRIVDHFGEDTLTVLDHDIMRLLEVRGLGETRVQAIKEAWAAASANRSEMIFLQSLGLSGNLAMRIIKHYETRTQAVLREDPYRLAMEISGVGFRKADQIAQKMGLPKDSPRRLQAAVLHVLAQGAEQGHCFLSPEQIQEKAQELLDLDSFERAPIIEALEIAEQIHVEAERIYSMPLYEAELSCARAIEALLRCPCPKDAELESKIATVAERAGLDLAPAQEAALRTALSHPLAIITGGPGTGKTTIIWLLARLFQAQGFSLALTAPTGRAAKRMTEATQVDAETIHRLLMVDPKTQSFQRNRDNPLEQDVVIVDESSMVDVFLFASLLDALPDGGRIILVGDADQLPPVGPGQVFSELIQSQKVPVARLDQVFRQKEQSLIVENAYRIINGKQPKLAPDDKLTDFYFIAKNEPDKVLSIMQRLVNERIPDRFELEADADLQILSPRNKGRLGVEELNHMMQKLLRKEEGKLRQGAYSFTLGDRVMQLKNNYELGVYNGDMGRITEIYPKARELVADFDGKSLVYEGRALEQLSLAYAITVHKSQGSEYPAVILPLTGDHHVMLYRKLVYTAITRARKLLVIVGSPKALDTAIRSSRDMLRNSHLAARIHAQTL